MQSRARHAALQGQNLIAAMSDTAKPAETPAADAPEREPDNDIAASEEVRLARQQEGESTTRAGSKRLT